MIRWYGDQGDNVKLVRCIVLLTAILSLLVSLWQSCLLVSYERHLSMNPATEEDMASFRWMDFQASSPIIFWPLGIAVALFVAYKLLGSRRPDSKQVPKETSET